MKITVFKLFTYEKYLIQKRIWCPKTNVAFSVKRAFRFTALVVHLPLPVWKNGFGKKPKSKQYKVVSEEKLKEVWLTPQSWEIILVGGYILTESQWELKSLAFKRQVCWNYVDSGNEHVLLFAYFS